MQNRWDGYISSSGIEPLVRILSRVDPSKAQGDRERFIAGLRPTDNRIINGYVPISPILNVFL